MARSFIDEIRYYELVRRLKLLKSSSQLVIDLGFVKHKESLETYQLLYMNLKETLRILENNCHKEIKELDNKLFKYE